MKDYAKTRFVENDRQTGRQTDRQTGRQTEQPKVLFSSVHTGSVD